MNVGIAMNMLYVRGKPDVTGPIALPGPARLATLSG